MELLFKILLATHIVSGSIGLFTGTINLIRPKGDKKHQLAGKFFFYGMIINAIAGFIMSIMHENLFLLIVAVFSFYMVATGQRFLSLKKLDKDQKAQPIDWALSIMMMLFALGFLVYGYVLFSHKNNMGIILLVFGFISILMARKDIRIYRGNIKFKNYWLLVHIQRMVGGYIATFTAFLVVNNTFLPPLVAWLGPTVVLVPLIVYWSRKYAVKIIKK